MEENQESIDGYLEKLALISESLDILHGGKKAVVFDLEIEEFIKTRDSFKNIPEDKEQFKVDISGVEFIYLLSK